MLTITKKNKTNVQLVAEIHKDFFTAGDMLRERCKPVSLPVIKKYEETIEETYVVEKAKKLQKLGFVSTKESQESDERAREMQRKEEELAAETYRIEQINRENEKELNALDYFTSKYPLYKFITQESVNILCEKYGLVQREVSDFIGDVPMKNLHEIENFKVDVADIPWLRVDIATEERSYCSKHPSNSNEKNVFFSIPLTIAAPPKDFKKKKPVGLKKHLRFAILLFAFVAGCLRITPKVEDPIVLQPILFAGAIYYLIVTAWGDEASEELVLNENFN